MGPKEEKRAHWGQALHWLVLEYASGRKSQGLVRRYCMSG